MSNNQAHPETLIMAHSPAITTRFSTGTEDRRNLGPLTTQHHAPSRCFDWTLDPNIYSTLAQGGLDIAEDLSIFVTDRRTVQAICPRATMHSCLPRPAGMAAAPTGTGLFFSPGLECPAGWQTAASVTGSMTSRNSIFIHGIVVSTLLPGENVVVCCPSGFQYVPVTPPTPPVVYCSSEVVDPELSFNYWSCRGNTNFVRASRSGAAYRLTLTTTSNGHTTQVSVSFHRIRVYAPTIQLNYRPQDVWATTVSAPIDSGGGRGGGLGGGVVAGIVVGAIVLLLLLVLVLASLLIRSRRRTSSDQLQQTSDPNWNKPELDGAVGGGPTRPGPTRVRSELEAGERHELDDTGSGPVYELGETRRAEQLDGESRLRRWSGLRRGMA
ncbi:hypothetical protein L249_0560 [Ophiocordyceps polyrhachis-furcata BCC 54312]|uniref:Uncharacterized protein n=1 Tax=Ophiocordyceps polyrhachis-furcata BCC 54312 TaxID=1330021 RepID=A0A367LEL1_9HYPO|nr:hypothetical protein L249_0560 [Ophiocordyceps polyrhachis-furcata BCC 54312]